MEEIILSLAFENAKFAMDSQSMAERNARAEIVRAFQEVKIEELINKIINSSSDKEE